MRIKILTFRKEFWRVVHTRIELPIFRRWPDNKIAQFILNHVTNARHRYFRAIIAMGSDESSQP